MFVLFCLLDKLLFIGIPWREKIQTLHLLVYWDGVHSHMSANIICLYYDPFFRKSYNQWLRFPLQSASKDPIFHYSPHQWPFFFKIWTQNFKFFGRFARISKILSIFSWKRRIFTQIWQILHQMTPFFEKFTPKKIQYIWIPHPMAPFFYEILHPCFQSLF